MGLFFFGTSAAGGAGGGIRKVADSAARTALSPNHGDIVVQLDTNDLWYWNGASWELFLEDVDNNDIDTLIAGLAAHLADTADAHLATDIGFTPAAGIAATTVQAAIEEVVSDVATALAAHTGDTTDAHAASAVGFTPAGTIAATTVQAAIAELDTETDSRLSAMEAIDHAAVTLAAFGSTPNANGLTLSTQSLNMEPASEAQPGGVSTAAQNFAGEKRVQDGLHVGAITSLGASEVLKVTSTTKGSLPAPVMTTAQRDAIGTPTVGMQIYNSDNKRIEYHNGTLWAPVGLPYIAGGSTNVADAGNITPADARHQLMLVIGSGSAPAVAADILTTTAKTGDILEFVGSSHDATVTIVPTANVVLNGTCTLGAGDTLALRFVVSSYYEMARSN